MWISNTDGVIVIIFNSARDDDAPQPATAFMKKRPATVCELLLSHLLCNRSKERFAEQQLTSYRDVLLAFESSASTH